MPHVRLTLTSRHQQQSASATSSSEQSFSDEHRKRRVAPAHFNRLKKRRRDDIMTAIHVSQPPPPLSLTRQSYFDKLMTCVRRTLVNRVNRSQYRTQWCVDSAKRNIDIVWFIEEKIVRVWSDFLMFHEKKKKKKKSLMQSVERLCSLEKEKIMCKKI